MAEVDGERKPRGQPRTHQPRRLRDISHLYLSSRSAPVSRGPAVGRRRCLRIGLMGAGGSRGQAEVCANMAVQLARLGQRTFVLDLEPHLPNVGFLLGLEPTAYMAHLLGDAPRLERALLGLRILEGGGAPGEASLSEEHSREIEASDCVLVNLPNDLGRADAWLEGLRTALRTWRTTTIVEAASRSPMFGTWMATARRGQAEAETSAPSASPHVLDSLLFVHDRTQADHLQESLARLSRWLPAARIRLLGWGDAQTPPGLQPWAWIRPERAASEGVYWVSSLFPEHPTSRTYQGLVQSLLAGAVSPGGVHV